MMTCHIFLYGSLSSCMHNCTHNNILFYMLYSYLVILNAKFSKKLSVGDFENNIFGNKVGIVYLAVIDT